MSIASLADLNASLRQECLFHKTAAHPAAGANATSGVDVFWTYWDASGSPAAATFAVGNTANGIVPTDATTGAPNIPFGSGNGHLSRVEFVADEDQVRFYLYDRLFHCGAYPFNANVTLASQPSYASRIPNADYSGTQLWFEMVTNFTGSGVTLTVTYTNQAGVAGRSIVTTLLGNANIGICQQVPLAAGDSGIQKIESITMAGATVGTFNLFVARPLWTGFSLFANRSSLHTWDQLGLPQVFGDSCLALMAQPRAALAGGGTGPVLDVLVEISSK